MLELKMSQTFDDLYRGLLKDVFIERAQEQLKQGVDGIACADAYAEQGKPDFALAHLLLADAPEEVKREMLAHAYEQRAVLSDLKADEFDQQYHRPFPLIKLEAQKDRMAAQQVRLGRRVRRGSKALNVT
jgi:hypothetical protein